MQYEFEWDKEKNNFNYHSPQKMYPAFYYVQNDFYHFGKMTYEASNKNKINAPEPITYVMELVQLNNKYKSLKK